MEKNIVDPYIWTRKNMVFDPQMISEKRTDALSPVEMILLKELRKNSRKTITEISTLYDIPASTLYDALRRLDSHFIKRHVSLLDFKKLGYNIRVNFIVKGSSRAELMDYLRGSNNVNSLYKLMNNEYDFFVDCVFKDMKELADFRDSLKTMGVDNLREMFVVDDLKREEFDF